MSSEQNSAVGTHESVRHPVRRALISVYDKTGVVDLALRLQRAGVQIISTGSTAAQLKAAGVTVIEVAEVTQSPEMLDGRVKTLHPRIHAGILADMRRDEHREQLESFGVEPFDLVIVNLYPFVQTVQSGADENNVVEQIDIGGPAMVRAAAKNHASVAVVVDPIRYSAVAELVENGGFTLSQRKALAAAAFAHTAMYDNAVASWTAEHFGDTASQGLEGSSTELSDNDGKRQWPPYVGVSLERSEVLRYGENPHQAAALYVDALVPPGIAQADQLHGKAMSYNNYVDADAALRTVYDFSDPAVAIIKHANPCGIAVAEGDAVDPVAEAHARAQACDPLSAYGGVIAVNRPVTAGMAENLAGVLTEVIVAPRFEPAAVERLQKRQDIRLLELPEGYGSPGRELRQVSGGMLIQVPDKVDSAEDDPASWTLVSGEAADEQTLADLSFAWTAVRAVKSNAILLAQDGASVGIGMGQVNRMDSCRLAVERANTLAVDATGAPVERARGAVAASDAFFPFADGLQILIAAGVRAVVQPGGSKRDQEVIAAAQAAGVTMYLTGSRHFSH